MFRFSVRDRVRLSFKVKILFQVALIIVLDLGFGWKLV